MIQRPTNSFLEHTLSPLHVIVHDFPSSQWAWTTLHEWFPWQMTFQCPIIINLEHENKSEHVTWHSFPLVQNKVKSLQECFPLHWILFTVRNESLHEWSPLHVRIQVASFWQFILMLRQECVPTHSEIQWPEKNPEQACVPLQLSEQIAPKWHVDHTSLQEWLPPQLREHDEQHSFLRLRQLCVPLQLWPTPERKTRN